MYSISPGVKIKGANFGPKVKVGKRKIKVCNVFNRPGVAGAVLQTLP